MDTFFHIYFKHYCLNVYLKDKYYIVYCFQISHAHAADLDDKTFNAKWDMLAKVRVWESWQIGLNFPSTINCLLTDTNLLIYTYSLTITR